MSVAFRRDGDDEHREPRFERPIPPGPNLVTRRGLALIAAEVDRLAAALAGADPVAVPALARDLRYWRTRAATALVTPFAGGPAAAFGARVRVRAGGRERWLAIVGHDEAAAGAAVGAGAAGAAGLVGLGSPLARALLGAEAGDAVDLPGSLGAADVLEVADGDA